MKNIDYDLCDNFKIPTNISLFIVKQHPLLGSFWAVHGFYIVCVIGFKELMIGKVGLTRKEICPVLMQLDMEDNSVAIIEAKISIENWNSLDPVEWKRL